MRRNLGWMVVAMALVPALFVSRWHAAHPGILHFPAKLNQAPEAPHLTLTDLNGLTLSTADLRGKVVIVNFWAAWCAPCAGEVPQFVALQQKYQGQGLQIIGISIDDDAAELRGFYLRHSMNYPVVAGNQSIVQNYGGILGLPTTLVIDRLGRVQKKLTGVTDFLILEQEVAGLVAEKAL